MSATSDGAAGSLHNQGLLSQSAMLRWLLLLAASGCGAVVVFGGIRFVFLAVGGVSALLLLAFRPATIVWLLFIFVLLVTGQLSYFFGISQAHWIPYLMVLLLGVKLLMEMVSRHPTEARPPKLAMPNILLIGFFLIFGLSALMNETGLASMVVAGKNYLFVWSLFALVGLGFVETDSLSKLWRFFLWVSLCQLPFALLERFYFAHGWAISWDAVVGSFGGRFREGGASGMMVFFLVFAMLVASSAYASNRISRGWHWAVIASSLATIALAEVKVVFVILPIGYFWLFRREFFHRPVQSAAWAVGVALAMASIFTIYRYADWDNVSRHRMSLGETLATMVQTESDPAAFDPRTREVSRIGALVKWYEFNPPGSRPYRFLFGNGPGASRESETIGTGVAARNYPFMLSTSTASVLLWDVGVVGCALFLLLLLTGAVAADRLARSPGVPDEHRDILRANSCALLLAILLTFYNRDAIDSAAMQFLLAAMLGHTLLFQRKNLAHQAEVARAAVTCPNASRA